MRRKIINLELHVFNKWEKAKIECGYVGKSNSKFAMYLINNLSKQHRFPVEEKVTVVENSSCDLLVDVTNISEENEDIVVDDVCKMDGCTSVYTESSFRTESSDNSASASNVTIIASDNNVNNDINFSGNK